MGVAESARPFFRWLFLHEKRGLEVQNFLTFPNSLWTFRKSKIFFWFITVFWGDLEGAGWFSPPHSEATSRSPALLGLKKAIPTDQLTINRSESKISKNVESTCSLQDMNLNCISFCIWRLTGIISSISGYSPKIGLIRFQFLVLFISSEWFNSLLSLD